MIYIIVNRKVIVYFPWSHICVETFTLDFFALFPHKFILAHMFLEVEQQGTPVWSLPTHALMH